MPLLHTWSLSVEEQFYCRSFSRWLTVLAVLKWMPRRLQLVLVALAVLSFATAVALMETGRHRAASYFAVSRFWEFLIGSWLALGCLPSSRMRAGGSSATGPGLIMIGCAVFLFDANTPFFALGLAALLPTVGAALVIFAGNGPESDFLYRLLASRGAVHLGKISYSLYLWHWPLLVYAGIFAHVLPDWYRAPVVGLSFVLAGWSFRCGRTPVPQTYLAAAEDAGPCGNRRRRNGPAGWQRLGRQNQGTAFPDCLQRCRRYLPIGDPFKDPLIETCSSFEHVKWAISADLATQAGRRSTSRCGVTATLASAASRAFHQQAIERGLRGVLLVYPGCAPSPFSYSASGKTDSLCQELQRPC